MHTLFQDFVILVGLNYIKSIKNAQLPNNDDLLTKILMKPSLLAAKTKDSFVLVVGKIKEQKNQVKMMIIAVITSRYLSSNERKA